MATILVTGGAGYIGSHCCKALAAAGHLPVCYDNLERGIASAVQWGPLEQGDLLDQQRLESVMRQYRPEAVMHFAALAYVGESVSHPAMYWRNNVSGSLSLLEVMQRCNVRQLIFSSTCSVYGIPASLPVTEATPLAPINPYGTSKRVVEQMLQDCGTAWGLQSVALRYFNAAGADPDGELGENHNPETHLIPLVLQSTDNPQQPVTVFGVDYPTADGSCIRDYIHVTDLADAHILALDALDKLCAGGKAVQLNLGTGRGYSVLEVIAAAKSVTGGSPNVQVGQRRPGDPPILVSDAALATGLLGWKPRCSTLEQMIADSWRWISRNAGL